MKKHILFILLSLLILLGIIFSLGITGKQQDNVYSINAKAFSKLPPPMEDGIMLERAQKNLEFKSSESSLLNLNLHTSQPNEEEPMYIVEGNGFLKFDSLNLPFTIKHKFSYFQEVSYEGNSVLVGLIIGEIKNKNNEIEEITINTVYLPDSKQGQFGVVVGSMGGEVFIPFGEGIINQELAELINREVYNQN